MNAAHADNTVLVVFLLASVVPLLILLLLGALFASLVGQWLRGFLSGVNIPVIHLLGMRFRGVPPRLIVDSLVTLVHRGHHYDRTLGYEAESLYLAQRGLIRSPEHLADMVEKRLKAA